MGARGSAALLGSVLASCVLPLDDPTNAHDLRILAMRAEPSEVMIDLADLATLRPPSYAITALVVDPQGGGRELEYEFTACAEADGLRCYDLAAPLVLARGLGPAGEWSTTFVPSESFLRGAFERDPARGFGGLRLLVALQVWPPDGARPIAGAKRVVFAVKQVEGQAANVNPRRVGLRVGPPGNPDKKPWPDHVVVPLAAGEMHDIEPEPPGDQEEPYVVPEFTGGSKNLTERWLYTYVATSGHFSRYHTGGADAVTGTVQTSVGSQWSAYPEDEGEVTFYVVVRDGRGGETWGVRRGTIAR